MQLEYLFLIHIVDLRKLDFKATINCFQEHHNYSKQRGTQGGETDLFNTFCAIKRLELAEDNKATYQLSLRLHYLE